MKSIRYFAGIAFIVLMTRPSEAQGFRHVATYRGLGGLVAFLVIRVSSLAWDPS